MHFFENFEVVAISTEKNKHFFLKLGRVNSEKTFIWVQTATAYKHEWKESWSQTGILDR